MSFYGNLFTICGYVADEKDLLKTYKGLADKSEFILMDAVAFSYGSTASRNGTQVVHYGLGIG